MPDSLNARMAAALAPVLGETAVYRKQLRCRQHGTLAITSSYERGTWCADCDRMEIEHGENIEWVQQSVDFADPAVGWGLWERWAREMIAEVQIDCHFDDVECHIVAFLDDRDHDGSGTSQSIWGAILAAWAQVLGLEESGDAMADPPYPPVF